MSYSLGVDLGTTFVAAATASANRATMFTLGDRDVAIPAAVYLREDGALVTGEAAVLRAVSDPDRVGREFKRRLGNPTPVTLGGQSFAVTALLGALLRDVLVRVTATEGAGPERVVLTHPANWGPFRRALFEEVGAYAGLESPPMVTEPEAAGAHYAASRLLAEGQTVGVYDLGGGTFDATVLRKRAGGVDILGTPEGIERLGGVDFDEAVLSFVDHAADGALGELDPRDVRAAAALARLRADCVLAKEALSVDTETVVPVFLPGRHFEVRISRAEFEDLIRAQIESTVGALARTLASAGVSPGQLSAVLLVGGSSRIPLVARMVSAELGRPIVVDTHPKYAVALGAATLADEAASRAAPLANALGGPTVINLASGIPPQRVAQREQAAIPVPGTPATPPIRRPEPVVKPPSVAPPPPPPRFPPPINGHGGAGSTPAGSRSPVPPALSPTVIAPKSPPVPPAPPQRPADGGVGRGKESKSKVLVVAAGVLMGILVLVVAVALGYYYVGPVFRETPQPGPASSAFPGPEVPIPALGTAIPVGKTPAFVAISPNGRQAYVANTEPQKVTVVDTAVNQVTATLDIPDGPPRFLAFAPDGRKLYVTLFNDQRTIHAIDVIDTRSNTVIATVQQPARPFLPAVTADGKRLFVPNHDVAAVSVIDTGTNAVISKIAVAPNPHAVVFSPDGRLAYTANHESNLVSVIDVAALKVVATIPVGVSPHAVEVNPRLPVAYAVNYDGNTVSVIDTSANRVTATIPVGRNPRDISWAPDGRFAYVVNEGSNTVSVIDVGTRKVTATIPTGAFPVSIAVQPSAEQAYISNLNGGTLTVLELSG
ncbi:MAG TPA: Hsp70 family protein [Pseudonocardiaceae bacterium]|nr:Hsp70 family protein [Pseudonocardiaceae bacterium]